MEKIAAKVVNLRLDQAEYAQLLRKAWEANVSLQTYIRLGCGLPLDGPSTSDEFRSAGSNGETDRPAPEFELDDLIDDAGIPAVPDIALLIGQ